MKTIKLASRMLATTCIAALSILTSRAQTPRLINAKTEVRAANADFPAQFREIVRNQQAAAWIGYSVPAVQGNHQMCCGSYDDDDTSGCGLCRLEEGNRGTPINSGSSNPSGVVKLEGSSRLIVFFRLEHTNVGRIRTFSENCELDAGGLSVVWLTGVSASQSVAVLAPFATPSADEDTSLASVALAAIALTGDPSADSLMQSFVAPSRPEQLREHTVFWLGAARGHAGYELLQKLGRTDSSDAMRSKVAFALYVSRDPAAIDEMIRMAKSDKSPHVRGQAIFWIAQKAGQKAISTITAAIENDPNTEVKKRAVFGLSQLPHDEGVPLLIEVAKTNANPAVRKQAMFWLGQSHDPRALEFFEEILAH